MKYDLVIWDYDGTLADSQGAICATFESTARKLGYEPPSAEAVLSTIGRSLTECAGILFPEASSEDAVRIATTYRSMYSANEQAGVTLFPGAAETVRMLGESGVCMAVVSNKGDRQLGAALEFFGLARYFHVAAGSGGTDYPSKPDPALYEQVVVPRLASMGHDVSGGRVLMVGDTDTDLVFGRSIGADRCWCSWGYGSTASCIAHAPEYTAETPEQIAGFLNVKQNGAGGSGGVRV